MSLTDDRRKKLLIQKERESFSSTVFNEELSLKENILNLNKDEGNGILKVKDVKKMINNLMPQNIELHILGSKEKKSFRHIVKCRRFSANKKAKIITETNEIDDITKTDFIQDKLSDDSVFNIKTKRTKKFSDRMSNYVESNLIPITKRGTPETFVKSNSTAKNNPTNWPLFNNSSSNSPLLTDFINNSEVEESNLVKRPKNENIKTSSINVNRPSLCESDPYPKHKNFTDGPIKDPKSLQKIIPLKPIELTSFLPSDEFLTTKHWEELDEVLSSGLKENLIGVDYNANSMLRHDDQMDISPSLFSECLGISDPGFNTLLTHNNLSEKLHSISSEEKFDIKHNCSHLDLETNNMLEQKLCSKTSSCNEFSDLMQTNKKFPGTVQKTEETNDCTMFKEDGTFLGAQGTVKNKICDNSNNGSGLQSHDFFHDHSYLNRFNISSIFKHRRYNKECKYPNINLSRDLIFNSESDIPIANEVTVDCTEDMSAPESKNYHRSDSLDLNVCDVAVENMNNKQCIVSDATSNFKGNEIKAITKVNKEKKQTYYYNHASSLSFLVQNVLENIFKHESHPSSTNMARLAKLLNVHWKDVKDWFVAKRVYYKKIGYSLRNKPLLNCAYCPIISSPDRPLVHLLSRIHIENIVRKLQFECPQFAKASKTNDNVLLYNMASSTSIEHHKVPPKYKLPTTKLVSNSVSSKLSLEFNAKLKNDLIKNKEKLQSYKKNLHENNTPQDVTINNCKLTNITKKFGNQKISVINLSNRNLAMNSKNDASGLGHKFRPQDKLVNYSQIYVGFRCPICNIIFKNEWMLIKHSLSHRKFICSDCEEVFETENLFKCHLQQHLMESITKESLPMFICEQCMKLDCKCSLTFQTNVVKEFVPPQKVNQIKPFASAADTGVNDHLKVSVEELFAEVNLESNKNKSLLNADILVSNNSGVDNEKSFLPNTYTNIVTFNCHACESFFFNNYELEEHLILTHFQKMNDNSKHSDEVMQKSSQSLNSNFFCLYCYVCYKNEFQLRRHLRFNCTTAPKKLTKMLYSSTLFQLMENGNGQHYYTIPNLDDDNFLTDNITYCAFCNVCKMNVDKKKLNLHLTLCNNTNKTPEYITSVNAGSKKIKVNPQKCARMKLDITKFAEKATLEANGCNKINTINNVNENYYFFICCYCEVPFYTVSSLHSHLKIKCQNRPKIETSLKIIEEKDYKKITKDNVILYYEGSNNIHIKQLLNFKPSKLPKRVICKFCFTNPYRKHLLVHLERFCATLPKEIKYIIKVNKIMLKSYLDTIGSNLIKDNTVYSQGLDLKKKCSTSDETTSSVYDCHLCDEQFARSNNFINHLSNKHNLKIEEKSVFKWLSQGRSTKINDNNIEENIIDQEIIWDYIADTMHVTDNIIGPNSEKSNVLQTSEIITNGELNRSSYNLMNNKAAFLESHNAKKKIICEEFKIGEGEDLLEDVDNLDSFVETIQLNDKNFEQS